MTVYTPRRIAALVIVVLIAAAIILVPPLLSHHPVYAAVPSGSELAQKIAVSVLAVAYMGGSLGYDIWLAARGVDISVGGSASVILYSLGRRASVFIWANGVLTPVVWMHGWWLVPAFFLGFQIHLWASITGLKAETA